jgi:dihydroflavonol-4-reductase
MRVLVTGATGFVGGRLTTLLCRAGMDVRASGHPSDPTDDLDRLGCEVRLVDLLDGDAVARLAEGVEAVFHVAAMVTFVPRLVGRQWRVNVDGTRNVIAACRRAGVRRLVYTSTVNTLGIPAPGTVGDEDTPFDWDRWHLGYMNSKRAAEGLVLHAAGMGLDAVCVLPGTMFGAGDRFFSAGTYIREAARGRLVLAPPGGTTVAHVDDVVQGHLLALERGQRGERYVLGGDHLSYATLFRVINEALGRPGPFGVIPAPMLRWSGRAVDQLRRLGKGLGMGMRLGPVADMEFSEGVAVAGCAPLYYDSDRARRALGYRPRPAVEGVVDAVDWYRRRGLI